MIKIKYLILIPIIFLLLLPACAIPLYRPVLLYYICAIGFYLLLLIFKRNYLFKRINLLIKKTPAKYFWYFILWLLADGFLLVILNKYNFSNYLYYMITLLLLTFIFSYFLPSIIFPKYLSKKLFIKFMFCVYLISCFAGLIQYISVNLNINVINSILKILTNIRFLVSIDHELSATRLSGLYEEPGYFGAFIFLNLPIVYNCCLSKYKIFDNKYLNKLTKILAIPLFWVCLILTKSPIWLVFCLLLTGIYFAKNIIAFIIKHFIKFSIAFVLICACIMLFLSKINTSDTYLNRIYVALQTFKNFEIFIFAEPSLATRVLSYYYTFKVFLANCILGVGLGNAKYYTLTQILNHPMPLTYEFHSRLNNILILRESKMGLNGSLFFDILSDTGIIGFVLFYYFLIKNYLWEKKLKLYYTGIYYLFLDGISKGTLAYIFISIYDINYLTLFIWFFFGMGLIFYPINNKNKLS